MEPQTRDIVPSQGPSADQHDMAKEGLKSPHTDVAASESNLSTPPTEFEIESLTAEQLEQIWDWNTPPAPVLTTLMHDVVAEQARKTPDKAAIESWDGIFTYNEIDTHSTLLAEHLSHLGVSIGSNVPLCFEKSKWTSVAVLAVMKAGGTFALMDPNQPEGRLRTIVEQTGATVVVTSALQEDLGVRIASAASRVTLCEQNLPTFATGFSLPTIPPETNLYIQFTSGSTGKPKGVLVTHGNYTSGAVPRLDAVGYQPHSRVLDFASYAFDVSIDCMLCTLAAGGALCIPSDEDRVNNLSGAIRTLGVNMAHMTPSVARVLHSDIIPSLEVLGLGGEAISGGDASKWSQTTKVVNAYGPSECTVGCTVNSDVGAEREKANITIGRGVGASIWIVDPADHNKIVPPGDVGELLVEGPIVGPGYLNEPDKTSQAFVTDPKFLVSGSRRHPGRKGRLYKTGDLGRFDTDGTIVFAGRNDQQVKLRGQRVELAEIEHHMRNNLPPETRVAAEVIKPSGPSSEPTLVAFVSERAGLVPEEADLLGSLSTTTKDSLSRINSSLSEHLPIYMVPAAYIPLCSMPLLVSAKTDRKRLRELGSSLDRKAIAGFASQFVQQRAPSSETEMRLASLWSRVLGVDSDVMATDSFFASGGDSLQAMKLVAAARADGIALSVSDIFLHPTLSDMALVSKPNSGSENEAVAPFSLLYRTWEAPAAQNECAELCGVGSSRIQDIYPCTPLQEGLMALSAKVSEAYVAQRVVEISDTNKAQALLGAFEIASRDCPILRTRIVQVPARGLQQVVIDGDFEATTLDRGNLKDYLKQDRDQLMGLGTALVRYAIVLDAEATGKSYFVLTMHHALYDGWAMPLIVDRVNRAYRGLDTARAAGFRNFIHYLEKTDRASSETYWRERLEGASGEQFPALPYKGYQQKADSLLEHYVQTAKPSAASTMATAIRGAWALLVSRYTSYTDIVFGETLTGRNAPIPGVEEIEGPMIATVPVRVAVHPETTVADYLKEIHEQSVVGIAHEHFGLQHIRRLSPDAREACELRTGFVLHPSADEAGDKTEPEPADGFVPAGDAEAAQEALKFNSYALMLVCSLDPKGFLIMASFDSHAVKSPQMETMLRQLGSLVRQFCERPDAQCGDLKILQDEDAQRLSALSKAGPTALPGNLTLPAESIVTATWIVNPHSPRELLPVGAVGELAVQCSEDPGFERVENPSWAIEQPASPVYRTKQLAKYSDDGKIVLVERSQPVEVVAKKPKDRVSVFSEKQRRLRKAWGQIMSLAEEEIGLEDSFFLLGGDSIGAMKLVAELRAEGYELSVANIFQHRTLYEMAAVLQEAQATSNTTFEPPTPFSLLDVADVEAYLETEVRPLVDSTSRICDVIPTRPLQEVAVKGTTDLPRYSTRYELFHLEERVDEARIRWSCQELVSRNEILRTVFIEQGGQSLAVILEHLEPRFETYDVDGDLDSFVKKLCELDVQTKMPRGSAFVKFLYVRGEGGRSCLALRISHAQYDEICLTTLLRQLGSLYSGPPEDAAADDADATVPFSRFVYHTLRTSIPQSIPYWRELLAGCRGMSRLPSTPAEGMPPLRSRMIADVSRAVDISARPRDLATAATLPTAAWALCLARRLGSRDVLFGEVVSGRSTDMPGGDDAAAVMGPAWQYVPVRVRFDNDGEGEGDGWTGADLLRHVQRQHVASAAHQGMGLAEIARECMPAAAAAAAELSSSVASSDSVGPWFDSVVHQDVWHVEEMRFGAVDSRLETVYPHFEPLREWKVQAFLKGDELTLEIVTFEDWIAVGQELLDEMAEIVDQLVNRPGEKLF